MRSAISFTGTPSTGSHTLLGIVQRSASSPKATLSLACAFSTSFCVFVFWFDSMNSVISPSKDHGNGKSDADS